MRRGLFRSRETIDTIEALHVRSFGQSQLHAPESCLANPVVDDGWPPVCHARFYDCVDWMKILLFRPLHPSNSGPLEAETSCGAERSGLVSFLAVLPCSLTAQPEQKKRHQNNVY